MNENMQCHITQILNIIRKKKKKESMTRIITTGDNVPNPYKKAQYKPVLLDFENHPWLQPKPEALSGEI